MLHIYTLFTMPYNYLSHYTHLLQDVTKANIKRPNKRNLLEPTRRQTYIVNIDKYKRKK